MRLCLLALGTLLVTGCHIPRASFVRTETKEFETQPLNALRAETFNGRITVTPSMDDAVHLTATYKGYGATEEEARVNADKMSCEVSAEDGELILKAKKPSGQWSGSVAMELQVPPYCKLDLYTSNGSIQVDDNRAAVRTRTSNGTVELTNIYGNMAVGTSNGKIVARNVTGNAQFKTSNGTISFEGVLEGDDNSFRTSNGSVKVKLPMDQVVHLAAGTSNGRIRCDLPTQRIMVEKKKSYEAIVGNGAAEEVEAKLTISTSNGSVSIQPMELPEMPGEIQLEGEMDTPLELSTDAEVSGPIQLP